MFQRPISTLVQELDSILAKQKVVSCVSEKAKWWEGRRALDSRVEVSVESGGLFTFTHPYSDTLKKKSACAVVCQALTFVNSLSETVKGDGGIAGMLEELSSTPFIGS